MKHILTTILLLFGILTYAQNISVSDFRLDEMDQTANLQGTTVLDQNGEKCALIKIITTETGFSFDVGSLGVQKTEQKTGEIWVYVPHGVRKMTLSHTRYDRLEYTFPMSVQKARTYKMELKVEKPAMSDKKQTLNIKFSPIFATVIVDGDILDTSNGQVSVELPLGNHKYNIVAKGYVGQEGTVSLKASGPSKLNVELDHQMSEAQVLTPKPIEKKEPEQPKADAMVAKVEGVGESFTVGGVNFLMVYVQNGTYLMGAHKKQVSPYIQERPAHEVTITKDYYIGETEVTQQLWAEVMGTAPSYDSGDTKPVEQVTWEDCKEFCEKLSARTGRSFRLPTSAEWEWAARGGVESKDFVYSGSDNVDEVGWVSKNSKQEVHPVKQKLPNELGIYDMTGNVWEWCEDCFVSYTADKQTDPSEVTEDERRVIRGGSFIYEPRMCRTSNRFYAGNYEINNTFGLRLAMTKE